MTNLVDALAEAPNKPKEVKAPKILVWDIENSPAVGHFWGKPYNVNITKVIKPSAVICFAAKWLGSDEVEFYSDYHDGHEYMVSKAWELLNEADGVISYNGKGHDSPHISTEFKLLGWAPPSPFVEIDLYRVMRRNFKFQKNGLAFIGEQLGIGAKVAHEGHELWVSCEANDPEAWAKMKEYNIGDIALTESLYWESLPWIPQSMHPHFALYGAEGDVCGRCGSSDLVPTGFYRTTVSVFQEFQCQGCGGWSRGKKSVASVDVRGVN